MILGHIYFERLYFIKIELKIWYLEIGIQTILSKKQQTMSTVNFPVLCIPRAMTFHTADLVEKVFNQVMGGRFVKTVQETKTKDRAGGDFNVFFIHPDQDFKANGSTESLYGILREQGVVNVSTGTGRYFWKVKLYVPHLKAQYLPPKPEVPVPMGPRIMTVEDVAEFEAWRREKAEREAKEAKEREINALGERLYPLVANLLPPSEPHAGKITGMILEWDRAEVEEVIASPEQLREVVERALKVIHEALASSSQ